MHVLFCLKKSVYTITSSETGYSTARPQVPTRKKVDLLEGQVTSSCGKYNFFLPCLLDKESLCHVKCFRCELGKWCSNKAHGRQLFDLIK